MGPPRESSAASYRDAERVRALHWKSTTPTLPPAARGPAPYYRDGEPSGLPIAVCLPPDHAQLNLLPEVRDNALDVFKELGIPWHAGVNGGPSNHLLDSQVQCVNALGQMVTDAERSRRGFEVLLGTAEVLEIEPGRWLTFEYIGDSDFFDEGRFAPRVRGTKCTSVDAAFVHRTLDGVIELVLVESKYTESYRKRKLDPKRDATRMRRYGSALAAEDGVVHNCLLSFVDLLDEPLYQLMRQQLLAYELEKSHAHGADRVRVLNVCPTANLAYQASLHRDTQRALGATVSEVWQQLLLRPDRFVSVDSAIFLDPEITSDEYISRYGPQTSEDT
jgi:hypothetical protein